MTDSDLLSLRDARENYVRGIVVVLLNSRKYLVEDYEVFLVANDRYDVYPIIAQRSGMRIVIRFKRPVLNRTEKDKEAYSETIFHMRGASLGRIGLYI